MNYGKVLELAELAKKYDLLPDPFLTNILMVAGAFDDSVLFDDAAQYITFKALRKMSSGYRRNHHYR